MQQTLEQISNQVTEKWNNLGKKQKIGIGVGAVAFIILIVVLGIFLSRPKMRTLYSEDIDPKSTAEVKAVLDENNIKYKIIKDGTNVQVQDKQFGAATMALSQAGVPDAGYTFTDAITNTMSTTQDEKQAKLNNLKKENLQSTLKLMDGIEDARIELAIPQESNSFLQSQQTSKASVVLNLSKPLTSNQAEGIADLVAGSVQNLDVKNVVVMDTLGNTLYSSSDTDQGIATSKQQELKLAAEESIKSKVNNLLNGNYDDVRISPNLVLDFDQYQVVEENYTAQGSDETRGVVQKETSSSQSSKGTDGSAQEPGTATNGGDTPTYVTDNATGQSESKANDKTIEYSPDKKVSTSVKNLGDINLDKSSLSVHVFKNKIYREEDVKSTLNGMTWAEFKDANSAQKTLTVDQTLIDSIKSATGIQNVVVNAYENPVFLDQAAYHINYKDYLPFILILLIIIIVAIAIMRFRKHDEEIEVEPELEVEDMLKVAKDQAGLEEIELKETLETKRQIDKFVDEKPEAVANLLRNWLTEEDWE